MMEVIGNDYKEIKEIRKIKEREMKEGENIRSKKTDEFNCEGTNESERERRMNWGSKRGGLLSQNGGSGV